MVNERLYQDGSLAGKWCNIDQDGCRRGDYFKTRVATAIYCVLLASTCYYPQYIRASGGEMGI